MFSERRWKHVQHALERYCDELASPDVLAQREAYALRDTTTVTERRVRDLVAAGKLPDPEAGSTVARASRRHR